MVKKKKRFFVEEGETIDDCLQRMSEEGYIPIKRIEKPVLKEIKRNGKMEVEVAYQQIIFEGKLNN